MIYENMLSLWLITAGMLCALALALYFRYRNQSDGQSIPSKIYITFYSAPHDGFGALRLTIRLEIGPLVSISVIYLFALATAISFFSSGDLSWLEISLILLLFTSPLPAIFKRYQQSWNFYEWGILYKDGKKK